MVWKPLLVVMVTLVVIFIASQICGDFALGPLYPIRQHFDHGYAVTSHSSQGLTAERVLVHADTSVHPDLLNSRFAYVSVSR